MDQASVCSSDLSDGLSNDTFDIMRRGRQDLVQRDARAENQRIVSSRFGPAASMEFDFPTFPSAAPASQVSSSQCSRVTPATCSRVRKVNFGGRRVISERKQQAIDADDMRVRWWSKQDLEEIKQAAKETSLRLRRQAKERGCCVETAHKKTSLMLSHNFQELVKLSASSPDEDLRHWCARSDGRRGLERHACREYGSRRKDDVMNTRTAVFQEQERLRAEGFTAMDAPEAVAKVSREKSRRARTFSLFMGEADAQAVTTGFAQPSSKRCKVAHSNALPSLTKAIPACHAQSSVRRFPMDAPLLRSLA
jgi:hypothetical protein